MAPTGFKLEKTTSWQTLHDKIESRLDKIRQYRQVSIIISGISPNVYPCLKDDVENGSISSYLRDLACPVLDPAQLKREGTEVQSQKVYIESLKRL